MTRNLLRAGALSCALLASTALTSPAAAQSPAIEVAPVDANGVDLISGRHHLSFEEGAIGAGPARLSLVRRAPTGSHSQYDGIRLNRVSGSTVEVRLSGRSVERFALASNASNGTSVSLANGSQLTRNAVNLYTHISADGTEISFFDPTDTLNNGGNSNFCTFNTQTSCVLLPQSIDTPGGQALTFTWDVHWIDDGNGGFDAQHRLAKVENAFGYSIAFLYDWNDFYLRTGAEFFNEAVSTTTPQSSVSYAYPSTGVAEVTDMAGQVWRLSGTSTQVAIRRPGASSDTTVVTLSGGLVTSVTHEGVTTNYARTTSGTTRTTTVTDALSRQTVMEFDLNLGRASKVTDALGQETSYTYGTNGLLTKVTAPEGNYVQYTYDARGNVTQTQAVAKPGSGAATITTSASFPSTCSNIVTCNQPTSVTDARGNVTDFIYDSTSGQVLTATGPAPSTGAARPQVRYSYTTSNGIHLLTGTSACATATANDPASCVGTADESRTVIAYDASGNVTSTTQRDGTGNLAATQTMTYDARGNLLTVDGPLSGTADTVRMRYDAGSRLIGMVSADPDGSGPLPHRAVRVTFTNGLPTKQEVGTVASQSDTDWAGFSTAQEVQTSYDANARPIVQKLVSGSTTYSLTQVSYDALGRPECTAQRMNPAEFGSPPSSACTLDTEGSFGPDRIVKAFYDELGRTNELKVAFGTADEAVSASSTFTQNGQLSTLTDGEGNKTTYEYDGHDRLAKTRFPSTTQGSGTSSTTDYEELTYDAGSNVTSVRLRDGQAIGMTYDALGRMTGYDRPNASFWDVDLTFTYDLLGRMTAAGDQYLHVLNYDHDALGRQTSEADNWYGTVSSQYDLAGRRTRITHQDGFFVDYDHNPTGEVTAIRENGNVTLATFGYDGLGRRTSLTRGNGSSTSYAYDAAGRLDTLTQDLDGTTHDLTLGFSYNPAGQIVGNTRSNDAYSFTAHTNQNVTDTHNGLNQATQSGSTTVQHDGRGNVSAIGGQTYLYSADNVMLQAPGNNMAIDPANRLLTLTGSSSDFNYDGGAMIAERVSGTGAIRSRWVHGPGLDEPLVQYDASGNRTWLHADERGSVVAQSDGTGAGTAINRYDEYGVPESGSVAGRFGYTGQVWLPEIGLHYYKARMYNQGLGRFMQPDPIGYDDGMNMYGYVGGDPVNRVDPTGLEVMCFQQRHHSWTQHTDDEGNPVGPRWDYKTWLDVWCEEIRLDLRVIGSSLGFGGGDGAKGPLRRLARAFCPAVPRGGPGREELHHNMAEGRRQRGLNAAANWSIFAVPALEGGTMAWFAAQVKTGGAWDFKNRGYEDGQNFGNFHYGAVARSLGYDLTTTLSAAHLYSLYDNGSLESQTPIITEGWRYANARCDK